MLPAMSELVERIHRAVREVEDPEVPVTLADLGVLRSVDIDELHVDVLLRPTRLGCPGRDRMERDVIAAVHRVDDRFQVSVTWETAVWTDSAVTARGREVLKEFGFAVNASRVICPYCSSREVVKAGDFGGALCKLPYTCRVCGSTFDVLRSAAPAAVEVNLASSRGVGGQAVSNEDPQFEEE